jgi:hypothetical protein
VLAEREGVQARAVSQGGVPEGLLQPLLGGERLTGCRVGLQVAERDDTELHAVLLL